MKKVFDFYSDPGHGWVKVSVGELVKVDLLPSDFSTYSYRRGDTLYLEEDCDAPKFLKFWAQAYPDCDIEFKDHFTNNRSRIRSYPHNSKKVAP